MPAKEDVKVFKTIADFDSFRFSNDLIAKEEAALSELALRVNGASSEFSREEKVVIRQHPYLYRYTTLFHKETIVTPEFLADKITETKVREIHDAILAFLRDPIKVAQCLKSLDDELAKKGEIENVKPALYIKKSALLFPGPPSKSYIPAKKHGALDKLLLKKEREAGINSEGVTKFIGFVYPFYGDDYVSRGNLFREGAFVTHGKDTHRLVFHAIMQAMEDEILHFSWNDGTAIKPKELLEIFVTAKTDDGKYTKTSLWEHLIDNSQDIAHDEELDRLSFSSSVPATFNSLLLCFGEELQLPSISSYLLDGHYKELFRMMAEFCVINDIDIAKLNPNHLYQVTMLSAICDRNIYAQIDSPFARDVEKVKQSQKYQAVGDEPSGIFKRKSDAKDGPYESYGSLENYLEKCQKEFVLAESKSPSTYVNPSHREINLKEGEPGLILNKKKPGGESNYV